MRDILIRGMEMPSRCGRCDMRISAYDDGMFDHYECCITAAIIDSLGEKMEDCPLVHVPPHGDLIDRDSFIEFIKTHWDSYDQWFVDQLEARPTIIPADTAEEGEI